MTTQTKLPSSIFPNFPAGEPVVKQDGTLTDTWSYSLSDVYQGLQTNFSNEGIVFPPLSSDQLDQIESIYAPLVGYQLPQGTPDISGKTVFDTTYKVPKQFIITYDGATPPNIVTASWKTLLVT